MQLGYFNYSTFENQSKEVYSEDVDSIDEQYANVGDAVLVSNNEVENQVNETENTNVTTENVSEPTSSNNSDDKQQNNNQNSNDYFVNSKLERDKMYAEMLSNYEKIINNTNCSEAQKSIATQEITKINNTKNAIMISENLIKTKGFENCVILVNETSVNVVIQTERRLRQRKSCENSKYYFKRNECKY